MHYHEFRAMNTDILLAAEGQADELGAVFQEVQAFIEDCEHRFTRFSESSELSALNRSAGTWFEASVDMFEVISLAKRLHERTRGLFDPAILNALEKSGYDRSMDEIVSGNRKGTDAVTPGGAFAGSVQEAAPYKAAPYKVSLGRFAGVRLDHAQRRIWLPEGLRIDLGGIAKGWIAEQAARRLASYAQACAVDAGGDVFFHGLPAGETAWRITLEDPWQAGRGLAVLKVGPGAVATSVTTKRRWQQDGKTQHHLIDPRTLLPAESEWVSVTVVARHTAEAEVFAKSLLIGGPDKAEQITAEGPEIEFIAVDQDKKLWGSKYSRELLDV